MNGSLRFILSLVLVWVSASFAFARGGGGCVQQGTLVETPGGPRAIETLAPGDAIWTWRDGARVEGRVLASYRVQPESYVDLTLAGAELHVTGEHPIAVSPGVFRQAKNIRAGDHALLVRDNALIDGVVDRASARAASRPAFNLTVFPGGQFAADGVLVHNKGGGCFLPHTPVLMSDGSTRAIGEIKPGDHVLAFSPDDRVVDTEVKKIFTLDAYEYWNIATDAGNVEVTSEHPFYVGRGEFRTAESLRIGDAIFVRDGPGISMQKVVSIRRIFRAAKVVNLQTDEPHTFFAAGFAVHNKGGGGGCFPAGTMIAAPGGAREIETIAPGDTITAVNSSGQIVQVRVASLLVQRNRLLTITTDAGALTTTAEHPLCTGAGTFVAAENLKIGDVIYRHDGATLVPTTVRLKLAGEALTTVYNLSVAEPHTFIANGFVVHNKGGFSGGGSSFRSSGRSYSGGSSTRSTADTVYCFAIPLLVFGITIGRLALRGELKSLFSRGSGLSHSPGKFSSNGGELDIMIPGHQILQKSEPTERMLAQLATIDPIFKKEDLIGVIVEAFTSLQLCWTQRDYGAMRRLVTLELAQEHEKQIRSMIRLHEINRIENIRIIRTDIVHVIATQKPKQRQITALITASLADYYVDDRNDSFLRGSRSPSSFQEFWTFTYENNRWVLTEIEQARESDALSEKNQVEGIDAPTVSTATTAPTFRSANTGPSTSSKLTNLLEERGKTDPLWRADALSKTARAAFLSVLYAREAHDENLIKDQDFVPALQQDLAKQIGNARSLSQTVEFRNLCVRKVQLVHADTGSASSPASFTARITAHAQTIRKQSGKVVMEDPFVMTFVEYYTFTRRPGEGWRASEIRAQEIEPNSSAA